VDRVEVAAIVGRRIQRSVQTGNDRDVESVIIDVGCCLGERVKSQLPQIDRLAQEIIVG
jgi:hypothetical protein